MKCGVVSDKKKKFLCTAFLIFLAISTTSTVLATWTLYKNCSTAVDAGQVYFPSRIKTNDNLGAFIAFYTAWGEVKTDGYSFGVGEVTVKQVKVSLKAKTDMSFAQFKAKVKYDGSIIGESTWKAINVGGYEYKVVYVDITDTFCDPDDFTIYIRVSKSTICSVYMDHVRAKVEY
ncbi:MAG: hypothetical protein ACFFB2_19425 [Promethearchaeota archaeon]